jgi:uncharacterized protein with HEPN domain
MSEAQRECGFYIDDMIGFAERVFAYTANMDQAGFVGNQLVYDATLRNLEHRRVGRAGLACRPACLEEQGSMS